MNREEVSGNMTSPPSDFRKSICIDTSAESEGDTVITDRHRHNNDLMSNKKLSPKTSKSTASPLQSFMGDLMNSKKITSIIEDNARVSSLKQNFAISKAEARKGSERWESASAFLSDISPTPTFASSTSSSFPTAALKLPASEPSVPIPSADMSFLSSPTSSRASSSVDAMIFPTSPLESPQPSPTQTSDRGIRTRSSSAPRIPKRRQSTDMSLSPKR